jgi:hypothetical protein
MVVTDASKSLKHVPLKDIRFTQDSINARFTDAEYACESTASALKEGRLVMGDKDSDLPRINVINLGGYYFSLDNRRLYCLMLAFGDDPNKEVCVWENAMTRKIEKELVWKFSSGFSLKVRGGAPAGTLLTVEWCNLVGGHMDRKRKEPIMAMLKQRDESASAFLAQHLSAEQIEAAREAVRGEYEAKLARLREEAQEKENLLAGYSRQGLRTDEEVTSDVLSCLSHVAYPDYSGIAEALQGSSTRSQLERVLADLTTSLRVVCKGEGTTPRFGLPTSPWANPRLATVKHCGLWTVTSSVAKRSHPDLDGPSLAKQTAFVGCTLSCDLVGGDIGAVIKLS